MDYGKKEDADDKYAILRRLIIPKLKGIEKQTFDSNTVEKFNLIFRVFLLRYLNLNYEFTTEELIQELERIRIGSKLKERIIAISNLLIEVEYGGKEISEEEFRSLADDAIQLIDSALKHAEGKAIKEKKPGIFSSLLQRFFYRIMPHKELTKEEVKRLREEKEKEQAKSEKSKIQEERKLERRLIIELRRRRKELVNKRKLLIKRLKQENKEKMETIGKQLRQSKKLKLQKDMSNAINLRKIQQSKKKLILEKSSRMHSSMYKKKFSDLRDELQKKKKELLDANDNAREEIASLEKGQKIRKLSGKGSKRFSGLPEMLSSSKSRNKEK